MTFFTEPTALYNKLNDSIGQSESGVPGKEFLDDTKELIKIFDVLGSFMGPVKSDMSGNVAKLEKHLAENPSVVTIQQLVKVEMSAGTTKAKNSATDAMLWLKRALCFVRDLLADQVAGEQNLGNSANKGYNTQLKPYHGWITGKIFAAAFMAMPYRADFLAKLGRGAPEATVIEDMGVFLQAIQPSIDSIQSFYDANDLDDKRKV